ncbi:ribosomal protein S18 acetylase RimI-like enzyme [Anaerosolibacter carboniphilus]|uniref:Ribosomal protein S18 acetylase RimI-like enzyme n=1 Tax=Anaerosolibacter carboniphilus TaxID=1417629 RepID=A0A841KUW5_9FIRM|nr:GNAT family N-acetyltransferase [Anaerosolibacter carboniphilus]MBB6217187.1 ribosomal protein S18 acetylase RimI-like enzyme [Anaerosolibacter carboniphilus]
MQGMLDYLKKNEYENVYMIRGMVHSIRDFRYEISYDENHHIDGIVAIWETEKGATLRGNSVFCSKWFDRLYGEYNLYELEVAFAEEKLIEFDSKIPKGSVTYNLIMVYTSENQPINEGFIEYRRIDKMEWYEMARRFKERYDKEFIEFEPDNMEWLCVYKEGEVIATICIEKVDPNLAMISSFYVIPGLRQQGIGTGLLNSVLRDFGDHKLMLFVDSENTGAMKLYEKLGFKAYKKVINIEI